MENFVPVTNLAGLRDIVIDTNDNFTWTQSANEL